MVYIGELKLRKVLLHETSRRGGTRNNKTYYGFLFAVLLFCVCLFFSVSIEMFSMNKVD